MSERPTPETDANTIHQIGQLKTAVVDVEFARKLERERDEARMAAAYFERLKGIYKRLAKSPDREATRVSPPRAAAENASCGHLGAENLWKQHPPHCIRPSRP